MPNWCRNRITVYGNEQTDKIKEVEKIFESQTPFNDIFPQPDWKNTPNEKGELPVLEQHKHPETGKIVWETYNFPDGTNDDRWYHWCIDNWGTKWEADVTGFEVQDYDMGKYDCLCEICFDINNSEGKIAWKDDKNPFECTSL